MDFVERTSAEDRARGIIEPLAIDFKKLAEEWKTKKKLDRRKRSLIRRQKI
jgi:hypothetical protein